MKLMSARFSEKKPWHLKLHRLFLQRSRNIVPLLTVDLWLDKLGKKMQPLNGLRCS